MNLGPFAPRACLNHGSDRPAWCPCSSTACSPRHDMSQTQPDHDPGIASLFLFPCSKVDTGFFCPSERKEEMKLIFRPNGLCPFQGFGFPFYVPGSFWGAGGERKS